MSDATVAIEPDVVLVLCPDGKVAEQFTALAATPDPRVLHWARLAAANCDDMHDGARCIGPHRIVRASWAEIER